VLAAFAMVARLTAPALRWRWARGFGVVLLAAACLFYGGAAVSWARNYARLNADQGLAADDLQVLDFIRANDGPGVSWGIPFPALNERVAVYARATLYLPFAGNQPPHRTNTEIKDRLAKMLWLASASSADVQAFVKLPPNDRQYERYAYYALQRIYEPYGALPVTHLAGELEARLQRLEQSPRALDAVPWPTYLILGGDGPIMARLTRPRTAMLVPRAQFGRFSIFETRQP
jgi:hypothetical protein